MTIAQAAASPVNAGNAEKQALTLVFVGHVDHGKSTLVGRLLADLDALPSGKLEQIEAMCEKRGIPFEWAFVLDALQAERDQGVTIDITQVQFFSNDRRYVIIDAPGHHEFIKNMVTGAAQADAAVLLVDAGDGVREQTRRHAYLTHMLGVRQILVAVTKMDLVGYSEARFEEVKTDILKYLATIGIDAANVRVVPTAARDGGNVVNRIDPMAWHQDATLIESLHALEPARAPIDEPLRLFIQDVYKFDARRIFAGRVETGSLKIGDELLFSPGNRRAKISSIETFNTPVKTEAFAGESVGITLDQQLFVERGHVATHADTPPSLTNSFKGRLFWLGHAPLVTFKRYKMKLGTADTIVQVTSIERVIDVDDMGHVPANEVKRNQIAEARFSARGLLALDHFEHCAATGRFALVEDHQIVGGGLIDLKGIETASVEAPVSSHVQRVDHHVPLEDRWRMNGHKSGVLWFTGLPASGKTSLSQALEEALFAKGMQVYVLDGDNVRQALSSDLGFSPQDRRENIRRVGEVAQVMARAGFIVVSAFISPYRADRDLIRAAAGTFFHEVYLDAPAEICEARDPRGLYTLARLGEIEKFTGVSAPYEAPVAPELTLPTGEESLNDSLTRLIDYTAKAFALD